MFTFEEVGNMLDDILETIPQKYLRDLNGGIALSRAVRHNKAIPSNNYYTLGQYIVDPVLGRRIEIFYGSFSRVYGHVNEACMRKELRRVLLHEIQHHVEYLAGDKTLVLEDADYVRRAILKLEAQAAAASQKEEASGTADIPQETAVPLKTDSSQETEMPQEKDVPQTAETLPETDMPQAADALSKTDMPQTETALPKSDIPQTEAALPESDIPQTEAALPESDILQTAAAPRETDSPQRPKMLQKSYEPQETGTTQEWPAASEGGHLES
ncbi:MAG: metallopeptidase family protein [Eubacterium sp.]|nr:metallopeptidase family protein [Eubacterium sp.]